jgi:hypothetical protein
MMNGNAVHAAHGQVSWNEELKAAEVVWTGFSFGREFETIMLGGIDMMAQHKGNKLLMDARSGSAIKQEDQDWIKDVFVAHAYGAGLRYFAMVLPEKTVAKMSISRTAASVGGYPYELVNFEGMEEAVQWLSGSPAAV